MSDSLKVEDIDENFRSKIYTQDYSSKDKISGVQIAKLTNHVGEDGDFSEILRIDEDGQVKDFPGFKIAQINRAKVLPKVVKAWHLHFNQDEIWYVAPSSALFLGLWDMRGASESNGTTMRINLGGGNSYLVYIPRGVAHGCANFTNKPSEIYYFINSQFDANTPDERRIPWDSKGADFWKPQRD